MAHDPSSTYHPGKGDLLIARPYLSEVFFNHAVVLLLDTDRNGALMGLSLNVPTDLSLHDLIPAWEGGKNIDVFCGGPCDTDRLFVLHTLGARLGGSYEVFPGLYIGGHIEDIIEYIEDGGETAGRIRFFVGYSGWHRNQLADELADHTWAVGKAGAGSSLLEGCAIPFWRKQLARLGNEYRTWLAMPTEAELN